MRPPLSWIGLLGSAFLLVNLSWAQEEAPPTPLPTPSEEATGAAPPAPEATVTLSKPSALSPEGSGPGTPAKPSQGEGEKAPVPVRPTAVPEFSLPEVVITGQNELTIEAKRLERRENDVTLSSRDLTGLERSFNDLPGLSKSFTALATEEGGAPKDNALVLHLGGGIPETYGGWGLWGQQFNAFQYILFGSYSNWGGERAGPGLDGDRRWGAGGRASLFPTGPFGLELGGEYRSRDAELPYENSRREILTGSSLDVAAHWALSDLNRLEFELSRDETRFQAWQLGDVQGQADEWEGKAQWSAEALGPFFNRARVEAGGRDATSDPSFTAMGAYDWAWVEGEAYFQQGEGLNLTARLQVQGGNGLDLPLRLYPALNLMWRVFGNSQINLYWQNDRRVDEFHQLLMSQEHVGQMFGFPQPTETRDQWGGRFAQKISENILLSLSGSTAQVLGYHQWSDLDATVPTYIQGYSTLAEVQVTRAGANLQWNFQKDWQLAATYQRNWYENRSGDGRSLTGLPDQKGILSLYRGEERWEARLEAQWVSERRAFEDQPGLLPAYVALGLDATYRLEKNLSLWFDADNLLGQDQQLAPGYPEPKFHLRGGVEIIF